MPAPPPNFVRRRACRTSCIATARTCVRHLPGNLLAAVRHIFFLVLERSSTQFTRRPVPQTFLYVLPQHYLQRFQWRRRRVQLWCPVLRDPPLTHVGLPWLSVVCLRPSCLDGCPYSLTWASFPGDPCVHLVATDVLHFLRRLALAHSSGSSHPPFSVIPMPSFPQAEQFLLVMVHEFLHFILHVTCSFALVFS